MADLPGKSGQSNQQCFPSAKVAKSSGLAIFTAVDISLRHSQLKLILFFDRYLQYWAMVVRTVY
jgi:hypothetical protein